MGGKRPDDPANIVANLTANFVDALVNTTKQGDRILPVGVGIKYASSVYIVKRAISHIGCP